MTLAGMIAAIRRRPGKGSFIALTDGTARIELEVFERLFQDVSDHLAGDEIIVVRGQVRFDDYRGGFRIVADEVYSVDEAREKFARRVEITINRSELGRASCRKRE